MTDMDLLKVESLRKTFSVRRADRPGHEHFTAVDDVSFTVAPGGAVAVVGESGSGKSTVARLIVGLESVTSGDIEVEGRSWTPGRSPRTSGRRRRGRVVQMVFQDPYQSLDRRQNVRECIDEILRLHTDLDRVGRVRRTAELLDQVQMDDRMARSRPHSLSGGQRQRVGIARALAAEPRLLILDEAVAALDVAIQAQVLALLSDIRKDTGVAFLFISHDLPVVQSICDDVLVMQAGRIVERGRVGAVLSNPGHPYTQRLIDSVPRPGWKPRRHRLVDSTTHGSATQIVRSVADDDDDRMQHSLFQVPTASGDDL